MTHLYPRALHTCARPMPGLPAVPSTTVPPGFKTPRLSASSTIHLAARSFTDPPGFMNSALPRISQPVSSLKVRRRIKGVLPTAPVNPSLKLIVFLQPLASIVATSGGVVHCVLGSRDAEVLRGQLALQSRQCAAHMRLYCAQRQSDRVRDLLMAQAVKERQAQQVPALRRQGLEGAVHGAARLGPRQHLCRVAALARHRCRRRTVPLVIQGTQCSALPQTVEGAIPRHDG